MDKSITVKKLIKKNSKSAIILIVLILFSSFLASYPVIILKDTIDNLVKASTNDVVSSKIISNIALLATIYLAFQIGHSIINNITKLYTNNLTARLSHQIRYDIYEHINSLSQSFFDNNDSSELLNKLIQDSDVATQGFISPVSNLSKAIFSFAFGLIFMLTINPMLTLILLPFALVAGIITRLSGGKFRLFAIENRKRNQAMWRNYQENIKGMRDIHASCQEDVRKKYVEDGSLSVVKNIKSTARYAFVVDLIHNFAFLLIIGIALLIGANLIIDGKASVGDLVAILTFNSLLSSPAQNLISMFIDLFKVKVSIQRINAVMTTKGDDSYNYSVTDLDLNDWQTALSFNSVSFSYNDHSKIFEDLNFEVKRGQKVAFVGATGSGKTTILKLTQGFYPDYQGKINLFDMQMNATNKLSIRKYMSYAFQDTFLFNASIKDNILFANTFASEEELAIAIKVSCLEEVIEKLPQGIDTIIGENGIKLSGGERQRVGVARALLKKPTLLLLDEATSALDNNTEKQLMININAYYKNVTMLIVAHRLTTIEHCDQIFVLDQGKIIEQGNHSQLINKNGIYFHMYNASKNSN